MVGLRLEARDCLSPDHIWMLQVLDDNKKLCLNSGEIIQMSNSMVRCPALLIRPFAASLFCQQPSPQKTTLTLSRCSVVNAQGRA